MYTIYYARSGDEEDLIAGISLHSDAAAHLYPNLLTLTVPDVTRVSIYCDRQGTIQDLCYRRRYLVIRQVLLGYAQATQTLSHRLRPSHVDAVRITHALSDHLTDYILRTQPQTHFDRAYILANAYRQRTGRHAFVFRWELSCFDDDYHWISAEKYHHGTHSVRPNMIVYDTLDGPNR